MSHHEKKADEPQPTDTMDENPAGDDTEGNSRSFHPAAPTEPADTKDKNPTGDDTQGNWNPVRQ